jgi:hypothetical protein
VVLGGLVLGEGLVAGPVLVGTVLAGGVLAGVVGAVDVAGIEEFCAAGDDGTPPAAAWLPPALPECPVKAVTAAYAPPPQASTSSAAAAISVPDGRPDKLHLDGGCWPPRGAG